MPKAAPTRSSSRPQSSAAGKKPESTQSAQSLTCASFSRAAKSLPVTLRPSSGEPIEMKAAVKEFSSGSFGWSTSSKAKLPLDGHEAVDVTVSINITVQGSKPKPKGAVAKDDALPPKAGGTRGGSKRAAKASTGGQ